jgi:DNA-binding transcriptional LysR family regulator
MLVGNTKSVMKWLDLDEVEISISPQRPESTAMTAEPFYREPLSVIYPAEMELDDPLPVAQFARLPKVIREDGSLTLIKMNELLEGYPSGADYVAQLQGTTAVNEAVAAGLGVSLAPQRSAKAWLEAGSVRTCSLDGVDTHHDFYVVYSQQRHVNPAAIAFIESLRGSGDDSA